MWRTVFGHLTRNSLIAEAGMDNLGNLMTLDLWTLRKKIPAKKGSQWLYWAQM